MLSIEEERAVLLSGFLQEFGIGAEKKLQQDMVAHYLQCGESVELREVQQPVVGTTCGIVQTTLSAYRR